MESYFNACHVQNLYSEKVAIFLLFNYRSKAEKSDRETEGNHGRIG